MATLELRDICHTYDTAPVLTDVNIALGPGQSLGVVSPSGGGKSTLLSIAGLLLQPTSGQVLVNGGDVVALSDAEKAALRCHTFGFLFQHTQLVGSLRAVENVMAPAYFAHINSEEKEKLRERAMQLLAGFGLENRAMHFPYQLSGGQKRRVMAARALLLKPDILITDEPTNDMDAASIGSVTKALFDHVEQGGSLLVATHDEELAARLDSIYHI